MQQRNNLLPYYPKEHAFRELTQLYSFTGLKVVHDNSDDNHQQTHDPNSSKRLLEPKIKEIKNTQLKSQEVSSKQTPQKQRKIEKLEKKNCITGNKKKSQQRQLSRFRSQPRKITKTSFHILKY